MANSPPITWQLITLLQTQLQNITIANGWRTDIGKSVLIEDTQADASKSLPQIVIDISKTARTRQAGVPRLQRTMTFVLEASIDATQDNAKQQAHLIIADVESMIDQQSPTGINGIRVALATDTEILKRPDGLSAIVVQFTGYANYMPG